MWARCGGRCPANGRKVSCSGGDNEGILVTGMGTELSEAWSRKAKVCLTKSLPAPIRNSRIARLETLANKCCGREGRATELKGTDLVNTDVGAESWRYDG